jgi:Resolvase, N terminal domain
MMKGGTVHGPETECRPWCAQRHGPQTRRTPWLYRPLSDTFRAPTLFGQFGYTAGGPVHGWGAARHRNPTSKLVLTILTGVATWGREIMLERQREGIAEAKAAGKYKGRPVSMMRRRSGNCGPSWVPLRRAAPRHRPEFGLSRARIGRGIQVA